MSPDELAPQCVGDKVPPNQVGCGAQLAADRDGAPRPRLAGDQAQLPHQLRADPFAAADQLRVQPPISVGAIGSVEQRLDLELEQLPPLVICRGQCPKVCPFADGAGVCDAPRWLQDGHRSVRA